MASDHEYSCCPYTAAYSDGILFTKERITAEGDGSMEVRPIREELRAVLHDRYWVILIVYLIIYTLGTNFKNASLVYYCNYVLELIMTGSPRR